MNERVQPHNHKFPNASPQSAARRFAPLIAGSTIAAYGLSRRSKAGIALAAAGGALAYLGSRKDGLSNDFMAHGDVLINCSPEEAYRLYRDFEEMPMFSRHLESVTKIGDRQYRWTALGPMETPLAWDVEIVDDRPGEVISWRSLPGSNLTVEGTVRFRVATGKRGTVVEVVTNYHNPAGKFGRAATKLLGRYPSFIMQQDLRRFKALIETGEIPTIEGQSHGPRSRATAALRMANPDRPIRRDSQMKEVFNQIRRTA
ncbi:MAG: SRPBCC family protein [Candidatus Sulfotelmatobacter sp.]